MSNLDFEQRPSRRLWIMAAMAALLLHLGGAALAVAHLKGDDDSGGLCANVGEFAVEMESPKVPDSDAPPGPASDESQPSPPQREQQAELKQTDLPQEKPVESDDPDRLVSPNNSQKPQEDDPKLAAVQTENSPEQEAAMETAPQKLEDTRRESDTPKAPSVGIGKDAQKLTADWGRKISAYFDLHKRYPKDKDKTKAASVKVSLVLNRRGNVLSADVMESSGDRAFDEAALSMIHRSDPVPLPPAGLTDDQFSFNIRVTFKEKK